MLTFYCSDTKNILFGCPICINEAICQAVSWRKNVYCVRHLYNMMDPFQMMCMTFKYFLSEKNHVSLVWSSHSFILFWFEMTQSTIETFHSNIITIIIFIPVTTIHCSTDVLRTIFWYNSHLQMPPMQMEYFMDLLKYLFVWLRPYYYILKCL
jgi:hypothetical protein